MRKIMIATMALTLSGCASFPLTAKGECANRGTPEGSPGYAACRQSIREEIVHQSKQNDTAVMAAGLAAGMVVGASAQAKANAPTYSEGSGSHTIQRAPSLSRNTLCPNGQFIYGSQCSLAPDGSYVNGSPHLAPNGSYVGDGGPVTLCPNGQYVAGQCHLLPDGTYRGN